MSMVEEELAHGRLDEAVGLVVGTMREFANAGAIQRMGCRALLTLCESEVGVQRAADAGAIQTVCAALKAHSTTDEGEVLRWATTALLRLVADSAVRSHLAVASGAEEALLCALETAKAAAKAGGPKVPRWYEKVRLAHRWLAMHAKMIVALRIPLNTYSA